MLEDELGVCGCVTGVQDVRAFIKRCHATWMPAMRDKYPGPRTGPSAVPTHTQVSRGQGSGGGIYCR